MVPSKVVFMEKACKWCKSGFEIDEQDMAFYKKVGPVFDGVKYEVAPPTLCPDCRQQRRCITRNERKFLFVNVIFQGAIW